MGETRVVWACSGCGEQIGVALEGRFYAPSDDNWKVRSPFPVEATCLCGRVMRFDGTTVVDLPEEQGQEAEEPPIPQEG